MNNKEELTHIGKITGGMLVLAFLVLLVFTSIMLQIPFGNLRAFINTSSSMKPTIPAGSVVYSWKQHTYAEGDIVIFNKGDKMIVRRIDSFTRTDGNNFYRTKGDGNTIIDTNILLFKNIIGKEFVYIPFLGTLLLFVFSFFGFIILIVSAGIFFIGYKIVKLRREFKREIERRITRKFRMNY